MGPCTASSCCCQVQSLSWVPVRPPIAAVSIATLCHVPFRSPHTAGGCSIFCHRVLADYGPPLLLPGPCNLPWAPVPPPPHAAARPVICHGPLGPLLMYGQVHCCCTASHCCCLHRHTAMCHFQVSSHCWWVPFFVIGC
ncbi:unnamed protein product, partial [Staurois parvus]